MTQSSNIGMLVNHAEIEHLLTAMSDSLRNAAYKVANEIAPKGSDKYDEFFDEVGTLIGYDEDTNKALLRDCLDHYVQYANSYGSAERMDFNYYLETNFQMVLAYVSSRPEVMSYLTSLFATACGILSSVLHPVIEDIYSRGQLIDKIESFVTGVDNTYYLVYGEDIDNSETYDPKEDDLSDVDVSQSPEVLARLKAIEERQRLDERDNQAWANYSDRLNEAMSEPGALLNHMLSSRYTPLHPHINSAQYAKLMQIDTSAVDAVVNTLNRVWTAPGTEIL